MISQELKEKIKKVFEPRKVVCLTGAGISAESGIPTFRGKGGLWEKYDPQIYANTEGLLDLLKNKPQKIAQFIVDFYSLVLKANPNPAHLALAVLEKENILRTVITQNVDNLHTRSGSRNIIELHGNAFRIRCMRCANTITLEKDRLQEMVNLLKANMDSATKIFRILARYFPRCRGRLTKAQDKVGLKHCDGRYRVDIIFFGEMLPQDELARAYQELEDCRLLLLIGTSLVVYPAASLPLYAKNRGAKLIEINSERSAFSGLCDYSLTGKASEIMPEILSTLGYG